MNSMYDKNEIEDSLEFCRQIKEYEDISATDKGTANESQDKSLSVMAEEMETQSHSWDHILQEQDPVSVDFDAVKPFIAPPEPETSAKAMGGLLEKEEEAKRIQEKQREQARQKALARAEAAKKENEEAVRLKAEQERKAAEEARKAAEVEQAKSRPINPFAMAGQKANEQPPFINQPEAQQPELLTRAFKVTTTRENIIALGDFMNEHGIDFDKIEL